jgi:lipopolysaccharide/colanic/teichoic acid biosynthesis glycosyltransferase
MARSGYGASEAQVAWPQARSVRASMSVKRALDICFSLLLLVVLVPLFLLLCMLVYAESGAPVFFGQRRLGRGGRQFKLLKFSTIRRQPTAADLEGSHAALDGQDRDITRLGRFLRASGLNELPQLFNILRGEMSFIGPRPAVLAHEQYYTEWHRRRLDAAPGVTGLAQVCGRNAIPWGWRVALDRYYVEHYSLGLDLAILLKTAWVVLRRVGTEGEPSFYYDFTPPEHDICAELKRLGVWRFNPDARRSQQG